MRVRKGLEVLGFAGRTCGSCGAYTGCSARDRCGVHIYFTRYSYVNILSPRYILLRLRKPIQVIMHLFL